MRRAAIRTCPSKPHAMESPYNTRPSGGRGQGIYTKRVTDISKAPGRVWGGLGAGRLPRVQAPPVGVNPRPPREVPADVKPYSATDVLRTSGGKGQGVYGQ